MSTRRQTWEIIKEQTCFQGTESHRNRLRADQKSKAEEPESEQNADTGGTHIFRNTSKPKHVTTQLRPRESQKRADLKQIKKKHGCLSKVSKQLSKWGRETQSESKQFQAWTAKSPCLVLPGATGSHHDPPRCQSGDTMRNDRFWIQRLPYLLPKSQSCVKKYLGSNIRKLASLHISQRRNK